MISAWVSLKLWVSFLTPFQAWWCPWETQSRGLLKHLPCTESSVNCAETSHSCLHTVTSMIFFQGNPDFINSLLLTLQGLSANDRINTTSWVRPWKLFQLCMTPWASSSDFPDFLLTLNFPLLSVPWMALLLFHGSMLIQKHFHLLTMVLVISVPPIGSLFSFLRKKMFLYGGAHKVSEFLYEKDRKLKGMFMDTQVMVSFHLYIVCLFPWIKNPGILNPAI